MKNRVEASRVVRQIQGLAVLLSCLPAKGKTGEFFSLALSLDEGPWLDRITPLIDPARDEGIQAWLNRIDPVADITSDEALTSWLESLWIRSGLSSQEQAMVNWQADPDNMSRAIAEYLAVVGKLRPA
jgi:hypothetical protein